MNSRLTFRSWTLRALVPALVTLAAVWALHVYRSTHRIILDGFDHKLLALAGGSAALVDGDAHAAYQRRRELTTLTAVASGELIGFDVTRQELVRVNVRTGAAHPLTDAGAGGSRRVGSNLNPSHQPPTDPQPFRLSPLASRLSPGPAHSGESLRLAEDGAALVAFSPDGQVLRRVPLHVATKPTPEGGEAPAADRTPVPKLNALAFSGGVLYGAGETLAKVDPVTGAVDVAGFSPAFFDMEDPFYVRHRAAFRWVEQQAGLSFLYTQVYTGNGTIYYVLDGTQGDGFSRPGAVDRLPAASDDAAELVQFVGRSWVSPIQNWQAWGLLKSCFTPVRASDGKVIAMAGADVDITIIRHKTRWALAAAILIGVVSLVGASMVSVRVAQVLTRPLQQLKESALWLAAGHYGTTIRVKGSREVGTLAAILDRLRERLAQEHERSQAWLAEIRTQRERLVLVQALDELMLRHGLVPDAAGASGAHAEGGCHVWWWANEEDDLARDACQRMRLTVLIREARRAGRSAADVVRLIRASHPELWAVAAWDHTGRVLHFQVDGALELNGPSGPQRLAGEGGLPLTTVDSITWAELPANHHAAR